MAISPMQLQQRVQALSAREKQIYTATRLLIDADPTRVISARQVAISLGVETDDEHIELLKALRKFIAQGIISKAGSG